MQLEKALNDKKLSEYQSIFETLFEFHEALRNKTMADPAHRQKIVTRLIEHRWKIAFWGNRETFDAFMSVMEYLTSAKSVQKSPEASMAFAEEFMLRHAKFIVAVRKELGNDKAITPEMITSRVFSSRIYS